MQKQRHFITKTNFKQHVSINPVLQRILEGKAQTKDASTSKKTGEIKYLITNPKERSYTRNTTSSNKKERN